MKKAMKRASAALALALCLCLGLTAALRPARAEAMDMVSLLSPWIEGNEAQLSVSYELKTLPPYNESTLTLLNNVLKHITVEGRVSGDNTSMGISVDGDSLCATIGPYIQPKLLQRLLDCAKEHHVKLQTAVSPRYTATDADEVGVSRAGIPTVLLSLPLKYMHTSVETIDLQALTEGGRLIAHFLSELDAGWEEDLWI